MPPPAAADVKIDLGEVEYAKLPNIIAEVCTIFMTVFRQSKVFCCFLPLLCLLEATDQGLEYQNGMILGDLIGVVSRKDTQGFSKVMISITGIGLLSSTFSTIERFLTGYAAILFREILTDQLHKRYFRHHNFYKVNCQKNISNPDQRIGSDVEVLSDYLCWTLSTLLTTPFTIIYYAVQVGMNLGWIYPFIIIGYFLLVVVFSKVLRKPIVPRVCKVQQMEGRFRQQHLDIVENAECIAFVNGGDFAEFSYTQSTFTKLLRKAKVVQFLYIPVTLVMRLDGRMVHVVTYLICGAHIFAMQSGLAESDISSEWTKIVFVVSQLGWTCHKYVYIISYLIYIEAMIRRVSELLGGMDDSGEVINAQGNNEPEPRYTVRDLNVVGPTGKTLISGLTLDFTTQSNILIAGPSNVGKTSLLRVLRKLWVPPDGQVNFSGQQRDVMFVSQHMFFGAACATLRRTLTYPQQDSEDDERGTDEGSSALVNIINTLHLSHVLKSVDNELDRPIDSSTLAVLSSGERQRLALARVLYHRPKLVFLDEATNAVDTELVDIFFGECRLAGITTVTVSHNREHLYKFHDKVLEIHKDSTWSLSSTVDYLRRNPM